MKYSEKSYQLVNEWNSFLNEQGSPEEAMMQQQAAADQARAEQEAMMMQQQIMAVRQGIGPPITELVTLLFQLSQQGPKGIERAKARITGLSNDLKDFVQKQQGPERTSQEVGKELNQAALDLQRSAPKG
jgi:hypothetical protein